jgi:hypothetical protein
MSCFLFNKIREQEGGTGSARKQWGRGEVARTMHTHVSKCKNNKMKGVKKGKKEKGRLTWEQIRRSEWSLKKKREKKKKTVIKKATKVIKIIGY